jgi:hypothetical protein
MRTLLAILAAAAIVGCASKHKDFDHMDTDEYRSRPQLEQALVSANEPLTEAAVQKLLASRVALPKNINLAIVRLSEAGGLDFQTLDEDVAERFYGRAAWGGRIQSIIPMPQMMVPKPITLASLRQAAVLLQADALLIVKPTSYADYKFRFGENKAKGITSLEVILLDTRTSAVPFTSLITESAEILKNQEEYSNYELMARARKASEAKALTQIPVAVQKFLSKAM